MAAPKLTAALSWNTFETAVLAVLKEALRRLAQFTQLPRTEEPINLELYWLLRQAHLDLTKANTKGMLHFVILFDSASQPEPDDVARSDRLRKRPDFNCVLMNSQAPDHLASQINYYVECKRLGQREGAWVLNENYAEHGIKRFVHGAWQYAKGYKSAAMVGYLQNSTPTAILSEVNTAATARGLPSLTLAVTGWAAKNATPLTQSALTRGFVHSPFSLGHLWVDLCHCSFVTPTNAAPVSAASPAPGASSKPSMSRKKAPTPKPGSKVRAKKPRKE